MASLQFPSNPVNGELYPSNPGVGEIQYQFDAAAGTWRLLGTATGVIPGTYGDSTNIPQFTVDSTGVLTFAQNIPVTSFVGNLQNVTDNGNTTTNPIEIDITGTGVGLTVVNSNASTDRVQIHPTFVYVRNGYIQVQENGTQSIDISALGVPRIQIRRDGYLSLGSGTSVFTERARINGQDGSAQFDGPVVVENLTSNGSIRVFELGVEVAQVAATGSFFNELEIGGLNYPTADAPSGYIMTTDGLGNLSLQPAPAVTASTLQAVTDNGNTTDNEIDFVDGVGTPVITIDPVSALVSVLPQTIAEPGTFISSTDITFGGSTASILAVGSNPCSLNFKGSQGVDLTTALGTAGISLRPGGSNLFSVTGTSTNIANALIASGLSYPTSDGTNGQVLYTDGNGNLGWTSVVTTLGDLQNVTNVGNVTTNSIIIDGTLNPTFPLIITATGADRGIEIKGDVVSNTAYIQFSNNTGTASYGTIASGPSYLSLGVGSTTPIVDVTTTGVSIVPGVTMTGGLDISGNISGIYQLRTSGLGGIVVGNAGSDMASIQGSTGDISTVGSLSASGLNYPTSDGSAGQVLSTDGNGNLGWGTLNTGNLQIVTDAGNTTTNSITVGGLISTGAVSLQGGPVAVESIQLGSLAEISSLNNGFANIPDTENFGNDLIIANIIDSSLGVQNRIIAGTSDLVIGTQGGTGVNSYYSELIVVSQGNGSTFPNTSSVSLGYGDGNQKLQTTGTGVTVYGEVASDALSVSGDSDFQGSVIIGPYVVGGGGGEILLGTDRSAIYANGDDTYLTNTTLNPTGNFHIRGNSVMLESVDGLSTMATFSLSSDSYLYYNNSERIRLDATGVAVSGGFSVTVSGVERFAAGSAGVGVVGNAVVSGLLDVTDVNCAGNLDVTGSATVGSLTSNGTGNFPGIVVQGSTQTGSLNCTSAGTFGAGISVLGSTDTTVLRAAGLLYPVLDGTSGQAIVTDGAGNLSFGTVSQTLQQVTNLGATTTNTITVQNAGATTITTVAPTGVSTLSGALQAIVNPGAVDVYGGTGIRLYNSVISPTQTIQLEGTTGKATVLSLTAAGLNYPTSDGSANQVLSTNGGGTLGWLTTAQVVATPASSATPGTQGQIAFGTGFFYWHDGTQWLRVAGNTF